MPTPDPRFGSTDAVLALAAIALVAFLVSWVVTDVLGVRRTPYVAALAVVVGGLGGAYLAWSGTSLAELVTDGWALGIAAGLVAGGLATPLVRRVSPGEPAGGGRLVVALAYEGVLYGAAEAVLLATLPALAVWQAMTDAGRDADTLGRGATGTLAVLAAIAVVLVHHLGYAEFRVREHRPKLAGALLVCGLQAVAFVATGNVLAPIVAHVLLHAQLLLRGVEMPPVAERSPGPSLAHMAGSEPLHVAGHRWESHRAHP